MKTIRSILQFRFDHQLSMAEIALASRVSQGTVHNILSRARGAGLDRWPLPEDIDDAALRPGVIPGIYVSAVAEARDGARPLGLPGAYDTDDEHLAQYADMARDEAGFAEYLDRFVFDRKAAAE